jgi:surface protein
MALSTAIDPYIYLKGKQIIFTDQPAPAGAETRDMSEAQDGGVVGWMQGDTFYVSTQRPGVKVCIPCCTDLKLFLGCSSLYIDVSMLDVTRITNMSFLFLCCESLETIDGLETWDVSRVTDMSFMFALCTSLKSINGLASWDVSHAADFTFMFYGCASLSDLSALAQWDTHNVTSMSNLFQGCGDIDRESIKNWNINPYCDSSQMFD